MKYTKKFSRSFNKVIHWLFTVFCISVMFCSIFSIASAATVLDEIQNYEIRVEMRPNGTMDIYYHVEWKVLDDSSEGPLSWVKIGIPNSHVDEIKAYSSNIKSIRYYSDGGAYVRVDFDRNYYEGETISFDFSIHQSYMYIIEKDQHICRYSFTPGWFDNIEVKNIIIRWNASNVLESTAQYKDGNYLVWQGTLGFGEKLNASVKYNLDVFNTNENEQYVEGDGNSSEDSGIVIVIIIILVVLIGFGIFALIFSDDYGSHGGFGGGHHTYIHTHSSCARSSCACVSCACACACAGGGRAGCSKKDFYGTNLRVEKVKEAICNKKA